MPAPPGNNYNMKWKTPAERQSACDRLCAHLRSGYSINSFEEADDQTLKRYAEEFPEDFSTEKIAAALRASMRLWETMGMKASMGMVKNFAQAAWIFNMKNRFGWNDSMLIGDDPKNPPKRAPIITDEDAARIYAEAMRDEHKGT